MKIDVNKVQIRFITGLNKCLPGYPKPIDVLYESAVESPDDYLFSEAKMENRYGIDEDRIKNIVESLMSMGCIEKRNNKFKIIKTPWL